MNRVIPIIFKQKEDCCGCGACMFLCPRNAITMLSDGEGFLYPSINKEKCISCNKCIKVCSFQRK